jgi:hypothetical protein
MPRLTLAAQEKIALRKNADAKRNAPRGVRFANYNEEALTLAKEISTLLPTDWRWANCGGIK